MQSKAPPEAAKHSGAMLVAGLLVMLRVGACPPPYTLTQTQGYQYGSPRVTMCCTNGDCSTGFATLSDLGWDDNLPFDDINSLERFEQIMCVPATETYSCCSAGSDAVFCLQPNTEFYQCVEAEEFVDILRNITSILNNGSFSAEDVPGGYPAIRCNVSAAEPANNNEGLSPGAIAGIAVGSVALVAIAAVVVLF